MDLRDQILQEHTKENCNRIIAWVGNNSKRFDELFNLFLNGENRITQRAAWPVSYCAIAYPEFMKNNFDKLIKNLQKPGIHDSIKRNTVRLLQSVEIPKKFEGAIMEICFSYVGSSKETVAIKAFSLTVLGNLAKKYPEIIPELKILIEDQIPYQTAAFRGRAKNLLKEIR
ncbi:MAG: hypothetical protein M3Z26_14595 [Bacteroidota bacterium]|nr:hypothetical protein [Bacteroidota bacterium]